MLAPSASLDLPNVAQVTDLVASWGADHPEFAALVSQHGNALSALRQFGSLRLRQNKYGDAIEAFTAALALTPADAWLWRELASACQLAGHPEHAAVCAQTSLSIAPDHAATWLQYASLADGLDQTGQSEAAYLRALALAPGLGDAEFGLGLLYLRTGKFTDASHHLQRAIALVGPDSVACLCLAQALYADGRYVDSAAAFEQAAAFAPLEGHGLHTYTRARTFAAILDGDITGAIAAYPALAGSEAEPLDGLLRDAFSLFSAYGYTDAAIAVGRLRLDHEPDNPVQRYLLDAVAGTPHGRAPRDYLEAYFDEFAEGFDNKLEGVLNYRVPEQLSNLTATVRSNFGSVLDLGCGTGLAAQHLRTLTRDLRGVDLSEKMLAQAARRELYTSLTRSDVIDFFDRQSDPFDLVFAADVLIYFGDLGALIDAIARVIPPGGVFATSIERADAGTYALLPSGRFAHSESYLERLAIRHFEIIKRSATELRLEASHPVHGTLYVLRRRES